MRKAVLILLALALLSGCGAAPSTSSAQTTMQSSSISAAYSAAPPSTLERPPRDAVIGVISHKLESGTITDAELVLYAASVILPPDDAEDLGYISIRDITVSDGALTVIMDSCAGMTDLIMDVSHAGQERDAMTAFLWEITDVLRESCDDMGRPELDCVAMIMSDKDPTKPLMSSINGMTAYDAGTDGDAP